MMDGESETERERERERQREREREGREIRRSGATHESREPATRRGLDGRGGGGEREREAFWTIKK